MGKLIYPLVLLLVFWLGASLWNPDERAHKMQMANAALVDAGNEFSERMTEPLPLANLSNFDGVSRQVVSIIVIMMASIVLALRRRRYHGSPRRR